MKVIKWLWLAVAFVLLNEWCFHSCYYGCLEEERTALLQFKASLHCPSLNDWVIDNNNNNNNNGDCCKWQRVECNTNTKRVTKLSLNGVANWPVSVDYWYLNASLFLPFHELQSLDLSSNFLGGCLHNQGFEVLSRSMRNLKHLDLSANHLNDSILYGLTKISSLKSLYLSVNLLAGQAHIKGIKLMSSRLRNLEVLDISDIYFGDNILFALSGFSSLKYLDLSRTELSGSVHIHGLRKLEVLLLDGLYMHSSILLKSLGALPFLKTLSARDSSFKTPTIAQGFYNLSNLEELFLDDTSLLVDFLGSMGKLSALKVLSLAENDLNGTLPAQGWCELKNLEELYLFKNDLQGLLPSCLGNLSSLQLFDVDRNHFTGNIASSPLANLTLLEYLSLSQNNFQIPVSFNSFVNHSNLYFFSCDYNKLIADPMSSHMLASKFQLKFFSMRNCTSKEVVIEVLTFLYNQHELRFLDLSHANLSGTYPSWLLENNTRLLGMNLADNSLTGPLDFPYHPIPNLSVIDISGNKIHGQISRNICSILPQLEFLFMAYNGLTGGIPSCLGNLSSLRIMDLSNNQFSQGLPYHFPSLEFVKLSNNKLDGTISPSIFNSSSLEFLYLDGNNFSGQILDISCCSSSKLLVMDISDNGLSGKLPRWIGNMSQLIELQMSRNHFKGPIPLELCELLKLKFLDLSENTLSGSIPFCLLPHLTHLHLHKNELSGPLTIGSLNHSYYYFDGNNPDGPFTNLIICDLGDNNITGPIPNWIGKFPGLCILLLKANRFDGHLPVELCLLEALNILDLSQNNFTGSLPSCLFNITFEATHWKASRPFRGSFLPKTNKELYRESMRTPMSPQTVYDIEPEEGFDATNVDVLAEFTTKRMSYVYKGDILKYMTGTDLSCNLFTGEIPSEIGNMIGLRALNLSHNNLVGSIPAAISNLQQIESLDISFNNLNGGIPWQLVELYSLAVFSVAFNNLSGKTPERKAQFGTFDESSYEGNPLLCGPPLQKICGKLESPSSHVPSDSNGESEDAGFIDMDIFYVSSGVCYVIILAAIAIVLWVNPYWRHRWFYFIEICIDNSYYFILDSFYWIRRFA